MQYNTVWACDVQVNVEPIEAQRARNVAVAALRQELVEKNAEIEAIRARNETGDRKMYELVVYAVLFFLAGLVAGIQH